MNLSNDIKITKRDLLKLRCQQADDMEKFLKSKGLYQEYYDIYVVPKFICKLNINDITNNFIYEK